MKNQFTKTQLKEIESQLSHPRGAQGIEIANSMNQSNIGMTKSSIAALNVGEGDVVLEIGHGNCGHLKYLIDAAEEIKYIGLEISETMNNEAKKQLSSVEAKNVEFKLYKGNELPLDNESVDRVLTVNTLYFWEKPIAFLMEIFRVLKNDGLCIVTYAHKEFMNTLPFVNEKFRLYNPKDLDGLLKVTKMTLKRNYKKQETVRNKAGDYVERVYSVAVLIKKE